MMQRMDPTTQLWQLNWHNEGRSADLLKAMSREMDRFEIWLDRDRMTATYADCLQYLIHRQETVSDNAKEWSWRALSSYFKYVASLDRDFVNPMTNIRCPKRPEAAVKAVTRDEYEKLMATCATKRAIITPLRDAAIIELLWCTGLRRGEVANLMLDDIDIEQGSLVVRVSKVKKPRVVPFSTDAKIALLKYLRVRPSDPHADEGWLWLGTKGRLNGDAIRLMLQRRSDLAGVNVSAHQFRRHFAARWLSDGGSQVSLQSICGWSSGAMPARYTRHAAAEVAMDEHRRIFR